MLLQDTNKSANLSIPITCMKKYTATGTPLYMCQAYSPLSNVQHSNEHHLTPYGIHVQETQLFLVSVYALSDHKCSMYMYILGMICMKQE